MAWERQKVSPSAEVTGNCWGQHQHRWCGLCWTHDEFLQDAFLHSEMGSECSFPLFESAVDHQLIASVLGWLLGSVEETTEVLLLLGEELITVAQILITCDSENGYTTARCVPDTLWRHLSSRDGGRITCIEVLQIWPEEQNICVVHKVQVIPLWLPKGGLFFVESGQIYTRNQNKTNVMMDTYVDVNSLLCWYFSVFFEANFFPKIVKLHYNDLGILKNCDWGIFFCGSQKDIFCIYCFN